MLLLATGTALLSACGGSSANGSATTTQLPVSASAYGISSPSVGVVQGAGSSSGSSSGASTTSGGTTGSTSSGSSSSTGTSSGSTTGGSSSGGTGVVLPTLSNSLPVALPDLANVQINSTGNPVNVLANDSDSNGDALTITAATLSTSVPSASGALLSIAADGRSLRYTPPAGFLGVQTLSYSISDGKGGAASSIATITVAPLQVPPVAVPDAYSLPTNAAATSLNVLANDFDGAGGGLTVTAASSTLTVPPGNDGTVSLVNGALRYQPKAGFTGVETLSYTLRDVNGATATAAAVITVLPLAAPPVALPDVATVTSGAGRSIDVLANDVDLAGGGLTLTAVSALTSIPTGSTGTFTLTGNSVAYQAAAGFVGVHTAQYTVRNAQGQTATGLITVTVTPGAVVLPPVAVADVATLASGTTSRLLAVLDNDLDSSGTGLTVSDASVVLAVPADAGITASRQSGGVLLTLPVSYVGMVTLSYTAKDGNGKTAIAPVVVTVTPAVLPAVPPVAVPDVAVVAQGSGSATLDVLANDIDPAGGGLTLSGASVLTSVPSSTATASVSGNRLVVTPGAAFAGVITLGYGVKDANGSTASGTAVVTVAPSLPALAPPLAVPDTASFTQNSGSHSLDVVGNDIDPAAGGLTLTAVSVTASLPVATHSVGVSGNQLRLTPAAGFAGVISLTYTGQDVQGRSFTGIATVTVTPALPLALPVALPDTLVTTASAGAVDIAVLGNDVDPAGGGLTLTSATLVTAVPAGAGSISRNGNLVRYTPSALYLGAVTVSYVATDSLGRTATGALAITVLP